jgi:DNA-binding MarR family transcriptional regulator
VLEQHGPHTVPEIARVLGSSRQNIQVLVNRLAAQGCVELTGNPAHKRSGLVHLTEQGTRLLAMATQQERVSMTGLARYVAEGEIEPAALLLRQIRRLLAGEEWESGFPGRGRTVARRPRGRPPGTAGGSRRSAPAKSEGAPSEEVLAQSGSSERGESPYGVSVPERAVGAPEESEPAEGEFPVNLL